MTTYRQDIMTNFKLSTNVLVNRLKFSCLRSVSLQYQSKATLNSKMKLSHQRENRRKRQNSYYGNLTKINKNCIQNLI